MYYKGAMELGWRAEEAFTAGCNKIKEDDQSSGVYEMVSMGEILFMLQIMTRKTAGRAGGLFQGGSIQNPETQEMIKKKRDYVEKYMDKSKYTYDEAKKHGVIQSYTSYELTRLEYLKILIIILKLKAVKNGWAYLLIMEKQLMSKFMLS